MPGVSTVPKPAKGPMGQRLNPKVRDYQRRIADRHDDLATLRHPGPNARVRFASNRAYLEKGCHILKYSA